MLVLRQSQVLALFWFGLFGFGLFLVCFGLLCFALLCFALLELTNTIIHSIYFRLTYIGFLDWCMKCGRVASEKDFGKAQAKQYQKASNDVYIGERVIPFTIVSHDPRQMQQYKESWDNADTSKPEWTYSEADMEEDFFHHRLGKHPTLQMILASIPVVERSKMPKDGSHSMGSFEKEDYTDAETCELPSTYDIERCPNSDRFFYWSSQDNPNVPSVDETEGIHVNSTNAIVLFQNLYSLAGNDPSASKTTSRWKNYDERPCSYGITANWNKESRKGTLCVRLYLRPPAFNAKTRRYAYKYMPPLGKLLTTWFEVTPVPLSEICGSLIARDAKNSAILRHIPIPPFQISESNRCELSKGIDNKIGKSARRINSKERRNQLNLAFRPSRSKSMGGQCFLVSSFADVMKQLLRELLPEDILMESSTQDSMMLHNKGTDYFIGVAQYHRSFRKSNVGLLNSIISSTRLHSLDYIDNRDKAAALINLRPACNEIFKCTSSIKGLLDHCENVSFKSITTCIYCAQKRMSHSFC